MKQQGKDIGAVKAYLDGKGDLAQAKTGAANLTQTTKKIPELFPPGTGGPNPTGDYVAKPEHLDRLEQVPRRAESGSQPRPRRLLVALNSGDRTAIETAFNDLGKNGCGACHTTFREKIEK